MKFHGLLYLIVGFFFFPNLATAEINTREITAGFVLEYNKMFPRAVFYPELIRAELDKNTDATKAYQIYQEVGILRQAVDLVSNVQGQLSTSDFDKFTQALLTSYATESETRRPIGLLLTAISLVNFGEDHLHEMALMTDTIVPHAVRGATFGSWMVAITLGVVGGRKAWKKYMVEKASILPGWKPLWGQTVERAGRVRNTVKNREVTKTLVGKLKTFISSFSFKELLAGVKTIGLTTAGGAAVWGTGSYFYYQAFPGPRINPDKELYRAQRSVAMYDLACQAIKVKNKILNKDYMTAANGADIDQVMSEEIAAINEVVDNYSFIAETGYYGASSLKLPEELRLDPESGMLYYKDQVLPHCTGVVNASTPLDYVNLDYIYNDLDASLKKFEEIYYRVKGMRLIAITQGYLDKHNSEIAPLFNGSLLADLDGAIGEDVSLSKRLTESLINLYSIDSLLERDAIKSSLQSAVVDGVLGKLPESAASDLEELIKMLYLSTDAVELNTVLGAMVLRVAESPDSIYSLAVIFARLSQELAKEEEHGLLDNPEDYLQPTKLFNLFVNLLHRELEVKKSVELEKVQELKAAEAPPEPTVEPNLEPNLEPAAELLGIEAEPEGR